jgi:hypothetical protein
VTRPKGLATTAIFGSFLAGALHGGHAADHHRSGSDEMLTTAESEALREVAEVLRTAAHTFTTVGQPHSAAHFRQLAGQLQAIDERLGADQAVSRAS